MKTNFFSVLLPLIGLLFISPVNAFADGAPPTSRIKPADEPKPMSLTEAKLAIGFPKMMADKPLVTGKAFRFTIIDSEFGGLDAWLEANPKWKNKVKYLSLRKDGKKASGDHGYNVFSVARTVMPMATFLLIETSSFDRDLVKILKTMKANGTYFASMSQGLRYYMGGADIGKYFKKLKLLEKYQFTFLKSTGNYRQISHAFPYLDADGDGRLEFSAEPNKKGRLVEENHIYVKKGLGVIINLGWNEWGDVRSTMELQLINKSGEIVAQSTSSGKKPLLSLRTTPKETGNLWIRLVDKSATPSKNLKFGLFVRNAGTRSGHYNGQESLNAYSQYESPFLISVGSFGKDKSGALAPSIFSSIGHTNSGKIAPHVVGPGQLNFEGEVLRGTSYATPFMAAMYSVYADYNIKNVLEETSTHSRWKKGLAPEEKSRWGAPDANAILSNNCTKSNSLENPRHSIEDQKLVIEFEFSRKCMEGLDYYLYGYLHGQMQTSPTGYMLDTLKASTKAVQDLRGWAKKHSKKRDIVKEPVRMEIPLKLIPREQMGKSLEVRFKLGTLAQWDPVVIPKADAYKFTLPRPEPYSDNIQGLKAAAIAQKALKKGGFIDAMEMADRALKDKTITEKNRAIIHEIRARGAIGAMDAKALTAFAKEDIALAFTKKLQTQLRLGGMYLANGNPKMAAETYKGCLDTPKAYSCHFGYMAASILNKKNVKDEVLKKYGAEADKLAKSNNISAFALAILLRKMNFSDFEKAAFAAAKSNRQVGMSQAVYYKGLIGVLSKKPDFAMKNFRQANLTGATILETALSNIWMKNLANSAQ